MDPWANVTRMNWKIYDVTSRRWILSLQVFNLQDIDLTSVPK